MPAGKLPQTFFRLDLDRSLQLHPRLALILSLVGLAAAVAWYFVFHPPLTLDGLRIPGIILVSGILLGLLAAVLAYKSGRRVHSVYDVERILGFAPIVQLPDFDEVSSDVADEYVFSLAAAIEFAAQQQGITSCVFTGSASGTGVSTLIGRVHSMLKALGRPTLLIDASRTLPLEQDLKNNFSLTDTAPILFSAHAEYFARMAGCTIVVLESGVTTRTRLRSVALALQRLNPYSVGFVLNRVPLAKADPAFRTAIRALEKHLHSMGGAAAGQTLMSAIAPSPSTKARREESSAPAVETVPAPAMSKETWQEAPAMAEPQQMEPLQALTIEELLRGAMFKHAALQEETQQEQAHETAALHEQPAEEVADLESTTQEVAPQEPMPQTEELRGEQEPAESKQEEPKQEEPKRKTLDELVQEAMRLVATPEEQWPQESLPETETLHEEPQPEVLQLVEAMQEGIEVRETQFEVPQPEEPRRVLLLSAGARQELPEPVVPVHVEAQPEEATPVMDVKAEAQPEEPAMSVHAEEQREEAKPIEPAVPIQGEEQKEEQQPLMSVPAERQQEEQQPVMEAQVEAQPEEPQPAMEIQTEALPEEPQPTMTLQAEEPQPVMEVHPEEQQEEAQPVMEVQAEAQPEEAWPFDAEPQEMPRMDVETAIEAAAASPEEHELVAALPATPEKVAEPARRSAVSRVRTAVAAVLEQFLAEAAHRGPSATANARPAAPASPDLNGFEPHDSNPAFLDREGALNPPVPRADLGLRSRLFGRRATSTSDRVPVLWEPIRIEEPALEETAVEEPGEEAQPESESASLPEAFQAEDPRSFELSGLAAAHVAAAARESRRPDPPHPASDLEQTHPQSRLSGLRSLLTGLESRRARTATMPPPEEEEESETPSPAPEPGDLRPIVNPFTENWSPFSDPIPAGITMEPEFFTPNRAPVSSTPEDLERAARTNWIEISSENDDPFDRP
jgi:hypothetical protein